MFTRVRRSLHSSVSAESTSCSACCSCFSSGARSHTVLSRSRSMVELWYGLVALMLTLYVVMDGFDLGAGALHLFVARTNEERRQGLAALGPYGDGNEVWLLATGGALFVAFPPVLAAGLSGFYFAIFLVLWCLILRGISIEFRSHVADPIWRAVWDAGLAIASALLAVFFGA